MSQNKTTWLEEKLLPIAGKLSSNPYLTALRDGVTLAMPLIITGSVFMIISSLPIPEFTEWLANMGISAILSKGIDSSFGLMGLVASFGIANSLAVQKGADGVSAGVISLSSFITMTPFWASEAGAGIPVMYMGSRGLFIAIIIGLLSASIYAWFVNNNIIIKLPDAVPPAVSRSFSALIPGAAIITGSLLIASLVEKLNFGNVHELIGNLLSRPLGLVGSSLFGTLVIIFLNSCFWFVGVHGGHTVNSVLAPIWLMNTDANRLAFQAGEELPHIITAPFMDNFVWMGGGGASLGLVIVIALFARRRNASQITKTMAPLTLTPGIFNINEPALFGIPIVMNISLLFPLIVAPMVNAVVTYLAMAGNIVSKTNGAAIPWTTPPVISGFLATGDWKASVLQALLIAVDVLIYYGFYRAVELQYQKLEKEN